MTEEVKFNPDEPQKFAKPITIAGVEYTHYLMRDSNLRDMYQAELAATAMGGGADTPLLFNGFILAFQLLEVSNKTSGSFKGPFNLSMLQDWGKHNYYALRATQQKLDKLGEPKPSDSSPG